MMTRRARAAGCALTLALGLGLLPLAASEAAPGARPTAMTACKDDSGWDDPTEPFHLYGNSWFVGTCGISAILVVTPKGEVLIDGATAGAAVQIEANIRKLGFRLADVRYILNSHAHLDHAGGIAQLQRDTGAQVIGGDAAALARGRGDRTDPQYLSIQGFAPIANVRGVADGETVTLGGVGLTAHATPGHTPGSTSWTWRSCEEAKCLNLAYVDSLSSISDDSFRFTDTAAHPGALANMRGSIAKVADLPCDVLLTPHPSASNMWARFGPGGTAAKVDATACRALASRAGAALDARVAKEAAAAPH